MKLTNIFKKESKTKKVADTTLVDLTRAYIIFSLIYIPVSVLFLDKGTLEESILAIYTVAMFVLGLLMITGFVLLLAKSANDHNGNFGTVLVSYLVHVLFPLLTFKAFAYVTWRLLPVTKEKGLLCDFRKFVIDMFHLFKPQENLNTLIIVSLIIMFAFSLYSVVRNKS